MMWNDEGYVDSGEKFVIPSLNEFGGLNKSVWSCVQSVRDITRAGLS